MPDEPLSRKPLVGVRVLDFGLWRPALEATRLLADAGAEVLMVEPPGGGPMRGFTELFDELSAGKQLVELDLKAERGREQAHELAASHDVVIACLRPGAMERLGLGYEEVCAANPGVVHCAISGFGATGPLASAAGHDLIYQAWAGALDPQGLGAPISPPLPYADLAAGLAAAYAVSTALAGRAVHGAGARIDIGMAEVIASWVSGIGEHSTPGVGSSRDGFPAYGIFASAGGGHVALGVLLEDHFFQRLCDALDLPELRDLDSAARHARSDEVRARIAGAVARHHRDTAVRILLDAGVPVAPVHSREEMLALDHFQERGLVVAAEGGPRTTTPVRFQEERSVVS